MDYDGNDFQSQNFQLSGEENNRFSSGLRSYSLPKFELDEHFQVHLRFDSLVEPESLLGIQDQEESSWIEDFSPGNSTLEFTRSAAESCSISRRKNVWSEATSSESVEILLRSVGEDDVIDKGTNIFDLDAHNGLSRVNNHMDPSSIQDVSLQAKEVKAMNTDPPLPLDVNKKDLPRINKGMTSDLPDVQHVPNTIDDEGLGSEVFEELDEGCKGRQASTCGDLPEQCNLKEIMTLPTVESFATNEKSLANSSNEKSLTDHRLDNTFVEKNESNDQATSSTLVAKVSQDVTKEQIDPLTSSVNISSNDPEKISTRKFSEQVTESDHEDTLRATSQKLATDDANKLESETVTSTSDPKNEPSEACRINHSLDVLESSSSLESKAESSSLLMEECNEPVASEKSDGLLEDVAHQIEVLSKVNGTSGQVLTTSHETCSLVIEGEINMDGHSVKICTSDDAKQSTPLKIDSFEQVKGGSHDASFEPKVSLEKDDLHVGNVLLEKNSDVTEDCEARKPGKPVIMTEESEDAWSCPPESSKNVENSDSSVELHYLEGKGYGAQGAEGKLDSLIIHPPELTSHGPESAGIQNSAEDETLENDTVIVGDAPNSSGQGVQEYANPPNSQDDSCDNVQLTCLRDARSPEKCTVVLEPKGENSAFHVSLLHEKACIGSAGPDNLDSHVKGKPQGASAQNQSTQTVEGQPTGTLEVTGNAVNCKENSLQSVSFSNSSSEPHLLECGDGDPSCVEPRCGSPIVISCTQPSSGEVAEQELNRQLSDQTLPVSVDQLHASSIGKNSEENKSATTDPKESKVSEERSFTFEVGALADVSQKTSVGGWKPFPIVQSYEPPQAEERCSPVSGLKHANPKAVNESPDANKSTQREKVRSVPGSLTERSTTPKRKSVKGTPVVKEAAERDRTSSHQSVSTVNTINKDMQLEEKCQYPYSEGLGVKLPCASSIQTSKLPDLNTGTALFHQPFTDLQQVQLRAQIFVYGSLIQGIPPDEACMISAFGNADGARNVWDGIWRVTFERFHSQKSPTANLETPVHSHSGVRVHEQVSRSSPLQGKTASRTTEKGASTVISSFMSLPSPLWNLSPHDISQSNMSRGVNVDPNQILSPLHGYQSSHGKQYTASGNPWLSQASPVPWVASSQSLTLDTRAHLLSPPASETVQVTPMRDASILHNSSLPFLTPTSFLTTGVTSTVSATATVHAETSNKVSSRPEKHASSNQKTRKRRKSMVSEAPVPVPLGSQPRTELDSATAVTKHLPASIGSMPAMSSSMSPTHFQIVGSHGKEQKVIFSEETTSKIEQAKLQAEDAAAFAAAATRHMEGIWDQLVAQKNAGLGSEIETKLASAAVAAAAASSVAKAAAAAAKVASDAAMQAKMVADEALSNRIGNSTQGSQTVHTDWGTNMPRVTPFSIKGKDKSSSSGSVISAAKEAARRRVEAATAASKRAENLDAIVKAAELAALAVCQAGAVIAMGDPLPFTLHDLIDAGPEGYWKAQHPPAETAIVDSQHEKQTSLDCTDGYNKSFEGLNSNSLDKQHVQQGIDDSDKSYGNERRQSMENQRAPDHDKNQVANLKEKSIQEGSLVEVCFDEESPPRRIWYSAKVLSLTEGKAYVCSSDFYSNAGSGKLKEWISLEGEADKPPRIRIPHPTTAVKFEGTRKRRRAALGSYVWAVGDRVDAWLHDCWCEGVVTEKSKEDETKLTVCFSVNAAEGDTSTVSAWHLRPSLIWKDGHWVEWSRPREDTLHLHEGDSPQQKRHKLGRLEKKNDQEVQNIDHEKPSTNFQIDYSKKPEESRPLLLSENDKIFSLGKNLREENNQEALRIKRTGQKEGSRVIFGVPKPGKKRKFMEVSKHYVTGKINNVSEVGDATKHAKYLPPQATSGWRNTSRVDPKGRKGGEPRPKVMRPMKPQGTQIKSATEREGSFLSSVSASNGVGLSHPAKASASLEEKSEKNILETASFTNNLVTEESTLSEASVRSLPGIPTSKKKTIIATESDTGTKGKVASALEKTRSEDKHSNLADHPGKVIVDATELRRSSRRIQPTSRLLEGLQSSMVISKIPSVSHEKGARASHRNVPSSKGNIHG